jgi:uncharacterized membrane protein/protein-disulfide isomerase
MQKNRSPQPLPYRYYYIPTLLLVFVGMMDTTYLAISHYKNYTDISYSSFCALSRAINCDTVSQSPWSILLGLPVAIWGLFGYAVFGIILFAAHNNKPEKISLWSLLFLLGLLYSAAAIYFGYISATRIHSYCILCILSYGINFSLLVYAWIIRRRFDKHDFVKSLGTALPYLSRNIFLRTALIILVFLGIGTKILLPQYWSYTLADPDHTIATGMTKDFHPWIGAQDPILTIEEYSDYQCFQCYKMHFILRQLIARYPDRIRLIHHHYPMDNSVNNIIVPTPFHVGSGKMAMMAIYASLKGKFWETNDVLFEMGRTKKPFNTKILTEKTGLPSGELAMATKDKRIMLLLRKDILAGMKLKIMGTPSFVINNQVYAGVIPASILEDAIK